MNQKIRAGSSLLNRSPRLAGSRVTGARTVGNDAVQIDTDYEILSVISEDATGTLHRGRSIVNQRKVAIRLFGGNVMPVYPTSAEVIPGVISITGSDDLMLAKDGTPFAVMEMPQGICLESIISQKGVLPINAAIQIALNVALLVRAIHVHDRVHGHLCAANIFVRKPRNGSLKVELLNQRMSGNPFDFNFPEYLSPELCMMGEKSRKKDDLWAIAVLLHRMLLGRFPFDGNSNDEIYRSICEDELVLPEGMGQRLPFLADFLRTSLSKEPRHRPDGKELNLVLKAILARRKEQPDSTVPLTLAEVKLKSAYHSIPFSRGHDATKVVSVDQKKSTNPVPLFPQNVAVALDDPHSGDSLPATVSKKRDTVPSFSNRSTISAPPSEIIGVVGVKGELGSTIPDIDIRRIARTEKFRAKKRLIAVGIAAALVFGILICGRGVWGPAERDEDTASSMTTAVSSVSVVASGVNETGNGVGNAIEHGSVGRLGGPADGQLTTAVPPTVAALPQNEPQEQVTIMLEKMPRMAHIQLNGVRSEAPIVVPKSDQNIAINVIVGDRIVFSTITTADRDQVIAVMPTSRQTMKKKRWKSATRKHQSVSSSIDNSSGSLSSNPHKLRDNPFRTSD